MRDLGPMIGDLDPTMPRFLHWGVGNLGRDVTSLAAGAVPAGAYQADNDYSSNGYGSPCPPIPNTHTYEVTVHALNFPTVSFMRGPVNFLQQVTSLHIRLAQRLFAFVTLGRNFAPWRIKDTKQLCRGIAAFFVI